MNNRHHFLLPSEHYVSATDRVTRTEDFIPIWTYKKKDRGAGWVVVGILAAMLIAGYVLHKSGAI